MRLQDKVVVITGAGAGLGRVSAELFAKEGAKLVVSDVVADRAAETAKIITDAGGTAVANTCDVSNEDQVKAMVQLAVDTYGKLDVMYANAGIAPPGMGQIPFEDLALDDWNRVIGVNQTGVFLCIKHSVRPMIANGGGSIVVTTSSAGLVAWPGFATYVSSKHGANGIVKGAALDVGRHNIRVNAICPTWGMSVNFAMGPTDPVLGKSREELSEWDPANFPGPLKRPEPPRLIDSAYAALFLASDESGYMSGLTIPTSDGGTHARIAFMVS
ncbi:MAG: SDR family NAD(P)-dependent oxidoreductase [Acidimicrobiia bacterium]